MYDSNISVNKRFKSSVNLQYDLYNEDKILQYIPTTDLCDVLKIFIKSIITESSSRASFLAGPYGKGKSYLMLIFSYLISKNKNKDNFQRVLKKFKTIDNELFELIVELERKKRHLLPVVISNNSFDDFNQNFMLSLRNSLSDNGIKNIIPSTAYSEALNLLSTWENKITNDFDILNKCYETTNSSIVDLKKGLKNYELIYYKKFEDLYSCVTHGCKFNPLSSNDISAVYSDVAMKIQEYGYVGMFVIFDEFGVFLENQTGDFASRLNKIQSFAEKASSTMDKGQLHLCCITHKDVSLYCKDKNQFSDFAKISGRFRNLRFDRSLEENYQIICSAIEHKIDYNGLVENELSKNKRFVEELFDSNIFTSKEQVDYILRNGFPFNPISLYVLIQISEKVAQNERTLFTFISDSDVNGFNYFINNNSTGLLNVPSIYDYFENLIKDNEEYRTLYYNVESLKKTSIKEEEHRIFKVIAIMKLINDPIHFCASPENIALCLSKDVGSISDTISRLIEKSLLKENVNDRSIDFAVIADKDINQLIDTTVTSQCSAVSTGVLLTELSDERYCVSNKYNFEKCMTRFYRVLYLEASKLVKLNSVDSILLQEECDGLIINLINDDNLKPADVQEQAKKFGKTNLIIRFLKDNVAKKIENKARKIFAAKYIIKNIKNIGESAKNSLPIYIEDLSYEVRKYLRTIFRDSECICLGCEGIRDLGNCIYSSLVNSFPKTIVLNNEQINKNTISTVSLRSRDKVVQSILSGDQRDFGKTSAEATIQASFEDGIEKNNETINLIKKQFIDSIDDGIAAEKIVSLLHNEPIGMRRGVIPLFVAKAISLLTFKEKKRIDTVLLYNERKEIELNAPNLSKALMDPGRYRFVYAQISKDKLNMTNQLGDILGCAHELSFYDSVNCIVKALKVKVSNLTPLVLRSTEKDNLLKLSRLALEFKDLFIKHDLNNYDTLFQSLPKVLNCSFEEVPHGMSSVFQEYKEKREKLLDDSISKLNHTFSSGADTIKSSVDIWRMGFSYIKEILFEGVNKNIYQALNKIQYNNLEAFNFLSYAILNCSLDEWSEEKQNLFFKALTLFKSYVEEYKPSLDISKKNFDNVKDEKLMPLSRTLYTNILDSLDEYGSSLSNLDKAKVLRKILYEILN